MQQDINGQVLGVTGRTTKNGKTCYDVAFSDGQTYTTFKSDIAGKAQALAGQASTARVEVSQNGQYTNYNFNDIAAQGQLTPQAFPVAAGTPVGIPIAPAIATTPAIPIAPAPVRHDGGMSPEREAKIVRQSSFATAANLVGHIFAGAGPESLAEAEQAVDRIARHLFAQVFGHSGADAQPSKAPDPQPQTPQEMAAQINAEVGAPVVRVGVSDLGAEGAKGPSGPNQIQANGTVIPW